MPRTINENRPYYKEYQLYNKSNNDNGSTEEKEKKVRNRIKQKQQANRRTDEQVSKLTQNQTASYFSYQSIHIAFLDHYEEESCDIDKYHYYRDDYH